MIPSLRHTRRPTTKSGLRGVIYQPNSPGKPWKAYIRHQGVYETLGYFETATEAAHAYNMANLKYRGKDSWFNPIPALAH